MAYKAYCKEIIKRDDLIIITIEFTDTVTSYKKDYQFNHMTDINLTFKNTIIGELARINDLETGIKTLQTNWLNKEIK